MRGGIMTKYYLLVRVIRIALAIVVSLMLLSATCCSEINDNNSPVITSVPTPDFLIMVAPTRTNQRYYDTSLESTLTMARGIMVQINGEKIGLAPENRNVDVVGQRVSLFIDGKIISQDTLEIADGLVGLGGPYYLSWAPELMPGVHEVQFQFITDAGDILKYSWQMVIEK
jgi:hypothetical protein